MQSEDINVFHGARQFMHKWDFFADREAPSARGAIRIASRKSSTGNINIDGTELSSPSVMYVASQDGFLLAIEPGVRDLVSKLAYDWKVITYTSCEGHRYTDGRTPDARCVGVLPRNQGELVSLLARLQQAVNVWNSRYRGAPVVARVLQRKLTDRLVQLPVVDLFLLPSLQPAWDEYFAAIDDHTASFIAQLTG